MDDQSQKRTVYRICRFEERFELPKNMGGSCVDKGLSFVRHFVDPTDSEGKGLLQQLTRLQSFGDRIRLSGVYWELAAWAASYPKTHRGYLWSLPVLTECGPANRTDLALALGMPPDECQHILTCLEQVKLIEQVAIPAWAAARPAEEPARAVAEAGCGPPGVDPGGTRVVPGGYPGGTRVVPGGGATPPTDNGQRSTSDPSGPPTRNSLRSNGQRATVNGEDSTSLRDNEADRPKPSLGNGNDQRETYAVVPIEYQRAQTDAIAFEDARKQAIQSLEQAERPMSPTKSDGGGEVTAGVRPETDPSSGGFAMRMQVQCDVVEVHDDPPRVRNPPGDGPKLTRGQWDFGAAVAAGLMPGLDLKSDQGKDEIASFAGFFVGTSTDERVVKKALKHAIRLGKMKKYARKSKAKIWWSIVRKIKVKS